jgi:ATP-binding cassette, subfamily B, bacterial
VKEYRVVLTGLLRLGTRTLLFGLSLVALAQILLIVPPFLLGELIDRFAKNDLGGIGWTMTLVVLAAVARVILIPYQARALTDIIQRVTYEFSVARTSHIFDKDFTFFRDQNVGGVIKRSERGIEAFESFTGFVVTMAVPAVVGLIVLVTALTAVAGLSGTMILCVSAAIYVFVSLKLLAWRRPYIDQVNDAEDMLAEQYADAFLAVPSVKPAGAVDMLLSVLADVYQRYRMRAVRLAFASAVMTASQEFIISLTVIMMVAAVIILTSLNGTAPDIGSFIVVMSLVSLSMGYVRDLLEVRKKQDEFAADIAQMDKLLSAPDFRQNARSASLIGPSGATALRLMSGKIDGRPPLHIGAEIGVDGGARVAVVGKTGGGKSSLLDVIAGVRVTHATVYVGDCDLGDVCYRSVTDAICYVPQVPRFLTGGWRDGLFYGVPDLEEGRARAILEAMQFARIDDIFGPAVVPVTEFSGGERQRLSVARGLLSRQPVVVLDEPTSALDSDVCSAVWDVIVRYTAGRTLICATHDMESLARFDLTIAVTDGQVDIMRRSA